MKTLIIGKNSFICSKFKYLKNSVSISHKTLNIIDLTKFDKVILLSMPKIYKKKLSKLSFEKKIFKKIKDKRLIYFSTSQVYPDKLDNKENFVKPKSIYAKNKLKIENEIKKNFKNFLILRAPIIFKKDNYGKSTFFDILNKNFKKKKISFNINENSIRDLITLDDFFKNYINIDQKNLRGIYNIGSKKGLTVKKIIGYNFKDKIINENIKIFFAKKISNMTLNIDRLENKIGKVGKKIHANVLIELNK